MPRRKPTHATYDVATYTGPFAGTIAKVRADDENAWDLADTADAEIARDDNGNIPKSQIEALAAALSSTGTTGKTAETIRAYARVSRFWPKAERVPGLSFTHHRRTLPLKDLAKAKALLERLIADKGGNPGEVSERSVDDAVAAETGTVRASRTKAKVTQSQTIQSETGDPVSDVLRMVNETLTLDTLKGLNAQRLRTIVTVLGSRVREAQKVLDRMTQAPAKVSKAKAETQPKAQPKAPAKGAQPKAPAKAPAKVGMR